MDETALLVSLVSLFAMGVLVLGAFLYSRRQERTCPKCQVVMPMVTERHDYEHLTSSQVVEETVGSVDYQVHLCPQCEHVRTFRVDRMFSSFTSCPECSSRTRESNRVVVEQATTTTAGAAEVTESCRFCDYRSVYRQVIPIIDDIGYHIDLTH